MLIILVCVVGKVIVLTESIKNTVIFSRECKE